MSLVVLICISKSTIDEFNITIYWMNSAVRASQNSNNSKADKIQIYVNVRMLHEKVNRV